MIRFVLFLCVIISIGCRIAYSHTDNKSIEQTDKVETDSILKLCDISIKCYALFRYDNKAGLTFEIKNIEKKILEFKATNRQMEIFVESIVDSISYPLEAAKESIMGKVWVSFQYDLDNRVVNAKILRSSDRLLEKEILKAFFNGVSNETAFNEHYYICFDFEIAQADE